jgi:hypothetical protein
VHMFLAWLTRLTRCNLCVTRVHAKGRHLGLVWFRASVSHVARWLKELLRVMSYTMIAPAAPR